MATQAELIGQFRIWNKNARQLYEAQQFAAAQSAYATAVNFYNQLDGQNLYVDELAYTREIMGIPGTDISTAEAVDSFSDANAAQNMNLSGELTGEQSAAIADSIAGDQLKATGQSNQPDKWDTFVGDTFSDAGPVGSAISTGYQADTAGLNAVGLGNLAAQPQSGKDVQTKKKGEDQGKQLQIGLGLTTIVIVAIVGIGMLFYARSMRLI